MCNLYTPEPSRAVLAKLFNATWSDDASEWHEDAYPKYQAPIMRVEDGNRVLETMAWGVPITLPSKRPGTTITKHVTNVRNLQSSFWRSMLNEPSRRCLVPFNRFAEPRPGRDAVTGRPAQYWFTIKNAPVAAFAGIWRPSEGGEVFAFLTCEPNPLVAPLHPKAMPVILQPDDYENWLTTAYEGACALAAPFPSQLMSVS